MIHTTTQLAKFKLLVRRLRAIVGTTPVSVETLTVGLLERLWHVAATSAPRGDIGRHDDELIAEMVGWELPATALVTTLVETGWLDHHPEHRLCVHDWHDHAPNYVRGNVVKQGGFITAQAPPHGPPPKAPPQGPPPRGHPPGDGPIKPNLTKPNQEKTSLPAAKGDVPAIADTPPQRKPRDRDPLFDAIVSITGSDPTVSGSHVGRIRKLLLAAAPPYAPAEVLRMADPGWQTANMPWLEGRKPTLGEVEKYIGRVRNPSAPPQTRGGSARPKYQSAAEQRQEQLEREFQAAFAPLPHPGES